MSTPSGPPPVSSQPPLPRALQVAATLCWLCAALVGIGAIVLLAIAIPEASQADIPGYALLGAALVSSAILLPAAAYAAGGLLVRRGRRLGGRIAVLTAGFAAVWAVLPAESGLVSILSAVILLPNLAIVVLVIRHWRHLSS